MYNKTISIRSNPAQLRTVIESTGNRFGSVEFNKRKDGSHRVMCYRLGVKNPAIVTSPNGNGNRREVDERNSQVTVYDTNCPVYNKGKKIGRGDYRVIPLEGVIRVCVNGKSYRVIGR